MHQVRLGDVAGEGLGIYADKATITIHLFVCEFFFLFFFWLSLRNCQRGGTVFGKHLETKNKKKRWKVLYLNIYDKSTTPNFNLANTSKVLLLRGWRGLFAFFSPPFPFGVCSLHRAAAAAFHFPYLKGPVLYTFCETD